MGLFHDISHTVTPLPSSFCPSALFYKTKGLQGVVYTLISVSLFSFIISQAPFNHLHHPVKTSLVKVTNNIQVDKSNYKFSVLISDIAQISAILGSDFKSIINLNISFKYSYF